MASTTVKISTIAQRVADALQCVMGAIETADNDEDRELFSEHAHRLCWISELAAISCDGTITLDGDDMEAIWHWTEAREEAQTDAA